MLKRNGANNPRSRNHIGEMDDGTDMLALLFHCHARPILSRMMHPPATGFRLRETECFSYLQSRHWPMRFGSASQYAMG